MYKRKPSEHLNDKKRQREHDFQGNVKPENIKSLGLRETLINMTTNYKEQMTPSANQTIQV